MSPTILPPSAPDGDQIEDYPVVKLWDGLLKDSVASGRDCIEVLPPDARLFAIRGRAGGIWEEIMTPPRGMHRHFLRRLKVMAGFGLVRGNPLERGHFQFSFRESVYEVDVAVRARPDGAEVAEVQISHPAVADSK